MKRWFFIMLGGLGVALVGSGALMLWVSQQLPPPYPMPSMIGGWVCIAVGLIFAPIGFVKGRDAGEYDVASYLKSGKNRRDHHVAGAEIDFQCPVCRKRYHASPLLMGKPFTCRGCQEVFSVPARPGSPSPAV